MSANISRRLGSRKCDPESRFSEPRLIGFEFLPRGWKHGGPTTPEFRLTCNPHSNKLSLYIAKLTGSGSASGPAGEYTLDQLTIDALRKHMFDVIESVV